MTQRQQTTDGPIEGVGGKSLENENFDQHIVPNRDSSWLNERPAVFDLAAGQLAWNDEYKYIFICGNHIKLNKIVTRTSNVSDFHRSLKVHHTDIAP